MAPFASQKRDGLVLVNPLRTSNHHIRDSAGKVVDGRRANRKLTHQFHVPRGDSCRVQSFPRAIVPGATSVVTSKPAIEGHLKTGQRAAART